MSTFRRTSSGLYVPGRGAALTVAQQMLADGPWGMWKSDEAASATTLADSSGNARPMTVTGAPAGYQQASGNTPASLQGISWGANTTSHADGTVATTSNPGSYTLCAWVFITANPAAVVDCFTVDSGTVGAALQLQTTGLMRFTVYQSGGTFRASAAALALNAWHYCVGVNNAGTLYLRVDKVSTATSAKTATMSTKTPRIHAGNGSGAGAVTVGPTAYYESALSDARTDAHYDAA